MKKLVNISELSKILDLFDPLTKKPLNHTIRFWETKFKVIKPKKINNRRYYTPKQVEIIKIIKFLLKNRGMTIMGVKRLINIKRNELDDHDSDSLKTEYYKNLLKEKSNILKDKIIKIKSYGKKNSS
tara:strand:+ start:305 stop:685 length:381 start_codon:yes stop_codon:yes gene_type:complete